MLVDEPGRSFVHVPGIHDIMFRLGRGTSIFRAFMMKTAHSNFVLITFLLLSSQSVSKQPPAGSFCSATHFCDGEEDSVTKTVKGESEENEMEELVRQQYEDFPSPEVTFKQLEDDKLR